MTDPTTPPPAATDTAPQTYRDDELVYVDPDTRTVVGRVEWSRAGNPKSMPFVHADKEPKEKGERKRGGGRKYYPWGTYRSMKGVFKIEGKQKKADSNKTLDEILPKALEQPFWD